MTVLALLRAEKSLHNHKAPRGECDLRATEVDATRDIFNARVIVASVATATRAHPRTFVWDERFVTF